MVSTSSAYRRGSDTVAPDVIDRIMVGACAVVWLILIGVSVAATVALADLGQGFHKAARSSHTTWVLYVVIAVSALIIAGAIPVLMRARRAARSEATSPAPRGATTQRGATQRSAGLGSTAGRTMTAQARSTRVQAAGSTFEWNGTEADRIWLRGTVALAGTMGIALIGVATATYLMAVGSDAGAWIAYAFAGLVTVGMPVLEVLHVRQLRRVVAVD
jgi:hypothetical protein